VSDDPDHDSGRSTSLAMDRNGRLAISYEDSHTGQLKVARQRTDWTWRLDVADSTTRGLAWTSLTFDRANKIVVSYYDAYPANLKFARYGTTNGWKSQTLAIKGAQGLFSTVVLDGSDKVNVLYYNRQLNQTMLAREGSDGWTYETLQSGGGRYISADVDPRGNLAYAWFQSDNRLLHVEVIDT
jgi:hypothetical protein